MPRDGAQHGAGLVPGPEPAAVIDVEGDRHTVGCGAIEPQAARLAAERASWDAGSDLVSLAARLWAAGQRGDNDEFLRLDVEFHAAVLKASGNAMFAQFQTLVTEVLTGRTEHGLMPHLPHNEALQQHVDVASAIQRGEAAAAHAAMSRIVEQFAEEVGHIWSEHHRGETPAASPRHTTPQHTTEADGAPPIAAVGPLPQRTARANPW